RAGIACGLERQVNAPRVSFYLPNPPYLLHLPLSARWRAGQPGVHLALLRIRSARRRFELPVAGRLLRRHEPQAVDFEQIAVIELLGRPPGLVEPAPKIGAGDPLGHQAQFIRRVTTLAAVPLIRLPH